MTQPALRRACMTNPSASSRGVSQSIGSPVNVSAARIRGVEVVVRGRLWERLGLSANYTYQDARDEGDDARPEIGGLA